MFFTNNKIKGDIVNCVKYLWSDFSPSIDFIEFYSQFFSNFNSFSRLLKIDVKK